MQLRGSCIDESVFPASNDLYRQGCAHFMAESYGAVLKALKRRLHPKYDEYQEDVVPFLFCQNLKICTEKHQSVDRTLHEAEERRKWDEL